MTGQRRPSRSNALFPQSRRTYVRITSDKAGALGVLDLFDASAYHLLALSTEGRSLATQRLYLIYEKRFLEFLATRQLPADLSALNPLNARQAVLWHQQRRLGTRDGVVATATFLDVLKTWAAFLAHEGIWEDSPLRRIRRVKVRRLERRPYTRAEVNAMLHACNASRTPERDRLLVLLLLESGARIGEATGLQLEDVRLDLRTVRVLGKGNKERTIPIGTPQQSDGGPLFRAYRAYLPVRDRQAQRWPERAAAHLLLTNNSFRLTAEGGTDVVKRLGDAAGVDGAIPHRFRHTLATIYLEKFPGDEVGLRRILGHVSAETMRDYVHLSSTVVAQRAGRVAPAQDWLRERNA